MLVVKVTGPNKKKYRLRALIDTGSQKSYLSKKVRTLLGLKNNGVDYVIHNTFGGVWQTPTTHEEVDFDKAWAYHESPLTFNDRCIDRIAKPVRMPNEGDWRADFEERVVWFPNFSDLPKEIDLLIAKAYAPMLPTRKKQKLPYGPIATETIWGWVLGGRVAWVPTLP